MTAHQSWLGISRSKCLKDSDTPQGAGTESTSAQKDSRSKGSGLCSNELTKAIGGHSSMWNSRSLVSLYNSITSPRVLA
jgi:hypothetical protein